MASWVTSGNKSLIVSEALLRTPVTKELACLEISLQNAYVHTSLYVCVFHSLLTSLSAAIIAMSIVYCLAAYC